VVRALLFIACALSALGADKWTEYTAGPFHVYSDAGDKAARERLAFLEQLRNSLGTVLGVTHGKNDLDLVWPVDLFLFATQREYGPHALATPLVDGGSATLCAAPADINGLPHDLIRALTLLLLHDNTGRMPTPIETAVADLFATLKVNATHVSLGEAPAPGELTPERQRVWAKLQMLATQGEYSGKLRVYLGNLASGVDEPSAIRNAFDIPAPELAKRVDAYLKLGMFAGVSMTGVAFNPNKDFIEKPVDAAALPAMIAEMAAGGKNFPADSPRGLLAKGTRPAYEMAAKANAKWGEPYYRMAALETTPLAKVADLKKATTIEPRNAVYWQALAEAQAAANLHSDASKSWAAAERNAPTEVDRERIHQDKLDADERRIEFEIAEKKRKADEAARELQRIKDESAAEVHKAEAAANKRLNSDPEIAKRAVPWWDDPTGVPVSGTLTRVDCIATSMRLTVLPDSASAAAAQKLLIRDPKQLTVHGANEAQFACGIQKPARKIKLVHNGKTDAKQGTAGDVLVVEFP
jgi:hypothetical protein